MATLPSARWPAAAAALLLLVASVRLCRQETAARAALVQRWESSGATARHAKQAARAARDPDPLASGVALARVLFDDAFDIAALATLPRAEAAMEARRAEQRLALAGVEAARGLSRRSASWESAMLLGGARLLAAWRSNDADLYVHPDRWRAPLTHAAELAPGSPEPQRLLVTGYLATWQALSSHDRASGRRLLRDAFRDPDTLSALLPAWAAVAGSRAELESVLPAEPRPYDLLQQAAARQGDWAGYCAARSRWLPLTLAELQRRLGEAETHFAGGDEQGGRAALLATVAAAPPDRRTAGLFSQAIERLPAGQVSPSQASAVAAWLAWALPLWSLGEEVLPPAVLARAASLSPELPPEQAALAALAAGDLERAETWERRADRLWSAEWAPYAAAKAEALLARGHPDEASAVLDEVHRSFRDRWPYRRARERLAAARHEAPLMPPKAPSSTRWGGERWTYQGATASLELVAGAPATALAVSVDLAPAAGAVVELTWDGLGTGCFPVKDGGTLRVPVEVTAGPHWLVWRSLAGGRTAPGSAELVGSSPGSSGAGAAAPP